MKYLRVPLEPKQTSGLVDNKVMPGIPAFFYFDERNSERGGYVVRAKNLSQDSQTILLIRAIGLGYFGIPTILKPQQTLDITLPWIAKLEEIEILSEHTEVEIQSISILHYSAPDREYKCNNALHVKVIKSPHLSTRFSDDAILITSERGFPGEVYISLLHGLRRDDAIITKIFAPVELKLFNRWGLYDIVRGEVVYRARFTEFSPGFIKCVLPAEKVVFGISLSVANYALPT